MILLQVNKKGNEQILSEGDFYLCWTFAIQKTKDLQIAYREDETRAELINLIGEI